MPYSVFYCIMIMQENEQKLNLDMLRRKKKKSLSEIANLQ